MSRTRNRPLFYGEVLFDRFPDGSSVLGGAPFNVAWHVQALGREPLFVSRVGDDPAGRNILARMLDWGMDTRAVGLDPTHATGSVDICFVGGEPHFDIVADVAYDYITADPLPQPKDFALIYHGTLALRADFSRASFTRLCADTGLPLFFDVNLRSPWWKPDEVMRMIERATWLKLNDAELDLIAPGPASPTSRAEALLHRNNLDLLVLTKGARGALALARSGEMAEITPQSQTQVVDTVGAGDAFSAVVLLGLMEAWDLQRTLVNAQHLASRVVGQQGATPSDRAFYEPIRRAWELS